MAKDLIRDVESNNRRKEDQRNWKGVYGYEIQ
jgi:hypothetical protein